jgi:hypothetical protein
VTSRDWAAGRRPKSPEKPRDVLVACHVRKLMDRPRSAGRIARSLGMATVGEAGLRCLLNVRVAPRHPPRDGFDTTNATVTAAAIPGQTEPKPLATLRRRADGSVPITAAAHRATNLAEN